MRILFFILMLANAAFFAYASLGPGAQASGDAQIIGQQLNPEKIRLLRPEQVSVLARKPEPAKVVAAVAAVCLEWGAFSGTDVARAEQALEPLAPGPTRTPRRRGGGAGVV